MKRFRIYVLYCVALAFAASAQSGRDSGQTAEPEGKHSPGPAREIGGGAGTAAGRLHSWGLSAATSSGSRPVTAARAKWSW